MDAQRQTFGDTECRAFWDDRAVRTAFPLYFTSWFLDFTVEVSNSEVAHQYLDEQGGSHRAMLPMATKFHPEVGRVANSMPWYGSLGGVALATGEPDSTRAELLQQVKSWQRENDVTYAAVNLTPDEMPFIQIYKDVLKPDVVHRRRAQVTRLPRISRDIKEDLMAVLHPKARNAVRKGLSQGLTIERTDSAEAWQALARIHGENLTKLGGRPKPLETFHLLRKYAPAHALSLTQARLGEAIVASLLLLRVGRTIEYLTPAVDVNYRSSQALSALIWTEMLQGAREGIRRWNWGGTGWNQSSLHRFKERMGGITHNYATLVMCSEVGILSLPSISGGLPSGLQDYFLFPFPAMSPVAGSHT